MKLPLQIIIISLLINSCRTRSENDSNLDKTLNSESGERDSGRIEISQRKLINELISDSLRKKMI